MWNKILLVVGVFLLLLFLVPFVGLKPVAADGPYKYHKYPGPFGPYEKDVVTVACAQFKPVWGDTPATVEKMKSLIIKAAEKGANIILFAETVMNACDKVKDPNCSFKQMVEPIPGPSSMAIAELTQKYNVYVVYGFLEKSPDPNKYYNSAAIIGPQGIIGAYHKIHVFYGEEIKGTEPVAFDTPWGPVGVGICYDNYFCPELARIYTLKGARLLLNPTGVFNLPDGSTGGLQEQMYRSLQSHVCEDFLFIASCNKVGLNGSGSLNYVGQSFIIGPKGATGIIPNWYVETYAGPASSTEEELIMAKIDLSKSDKLREVVAFFQINPRQGVPEFNPQIWAEQYGTLKNPPPNTDVDQLKLENGMLARNFYIICAVAAALLLAVIGIAIVAFRKMK